MPKTDRRHTGRSLASHALVVGAGIFLGVASALGATGVLAARCQPSVVGGRETIRFPDRGLCGLVVWRRDQRGVMEVTVQSGAVMRMEGDYDASPGAAERLVPAGWRDWAVPWGWDGAWQPGMRRTRHLIAVGWPWPCAIAVLEASGDSPAGPGGWRPIEGRLNGPGPTSPWDPRMPLVWPTTFETVPLAMNSASFGIGWILAIAAVRAVGGSWVRGRRRRGGRCPWCGYPLAGINGVSERTCSECGRAV